MRTSYLLALGFSTLTLLDGVVAASAVKGGAKSKEAATGTTAAAAAKALSTTAAVAGAKSSTTVAVAKAKASTTAAGAAGASASTTAAAAADSSSTTTAAAAEAASTSAGAAAAAGGAAGGATLIGTPQPNSNSNGAPSDGQAASLTDPDNFINFCQGKTDTNGLQNTAGSCNPIPMGDIPAKTNMISTVITSPKNGDNIAAANTPFNIQLTTTNLQAGQFTNPNVAYYTAPQQVNAAGDIIGHVHVTVQDMGANVNAPTPPDPTTFTFFKGIDDAGDGKGNLQAVVTAGLPAGNYRICTMVAAANHQPVMMPVAQRGAQDDCIRITVGGAAGAAAGAGASSSAAAGGAAAATTSAAAAAGANGSTTSAAGVTAAAGSATTSTANQGAKAVKGGTSAATSAAAKAATTSTAAAPAAAKSTTQAAGAMPAGTPSFGQRPPQGQPQGGSPFGQNRGAQRGRGWARRSEEDKKDRFVAREFIV